MDLILCHTTADFDALGAAVGLVYLQPGAKIVLTGGAHPTVRDFLALHRDEFPLIERRSVNPANIRKLTIVDTQHRDRLGPCASWLDLPSLQELNLYDHHPHTQGDIHPHWAHIEPVGSSTTLIVEQLQQGQISISPVAATVMALGVYVDTGSLTYGHTTPRDARAIAWLLEQQANIQVVGEYLEPNLSPLLQELLTQGLEELKIKSIHGRQIGSVALMTEEFVPGLSGLTTRIMELADLDVIVLGHGFRKGQEYRVALIGRSRLDQINLQPLFITWGGGGHLQACSALVKGKTLPQVLPQVMEQLISLIPHPPIARDLMSAPVRTIRPDTQIAEAERILFRYGHSGLSVVDEAGQLVGIISRRDLDLALHHGFSHAPVKGYMTRNLKTISPITTLPEIQELMVTYDVGRLPVLDQGQLVGMVTRTDVLRQVHRDQEVSPLNGHDSLPLTTCLLPTIRDRLEPTVTQLLDHTAAIAEKFGWHLYLVGGGVRDLLLSEEATKPLLLQDIDLVVDGFHRSAEVGAGVTMAKALQAIYPQARVSIHGEFQTAALLWHEDRTLGNLWMDIATARTEFYPYPAANPEVEASSIRQDLYRRDFSINALALRLTAPHAGELLDFFGGLEDLKARTLRVLHANSFIEDPTRIYRGVRFAVRLGFEFDDQTLGYIRYALESGVYEQLKLSDNPAPALTTRLRAELKYILESNYWRGSLKLLAQLTALRCLDPDLRLTDRVWWQIRYGDRWLHHLGLKSSVEPWLLRLELLLADLSTAPIIASNLQLPKDSIHRLTILAPAIATLVEQLTPAQQPSEIYRVLITYKLPLLLLIAPKLAPSLRRKLWLYLTRLQFTKTCLNGSDLKAMGYKPGPQFKAILDDLLWATLDQCINNREDAIEWVNSYSGE